MLKGFILNHYWTLLSRFYLVQPHRLTEDFLSIDFEDVISREIDYFLSLQNLPTGQQAELMIGSLFKLVLFTRNLLSQQSFKAELGAQISQLTEKNLL